MEDPQLFIRYKVKDVAYECDVVSGESKVVIGDRITKYPNAIEGFNSFWGSAGFQLLEEVRDALERNGFDRWTGIRKGEIR